MTKEGTHRIVKMSGKTKITASINKNAVRAIFNQSQKAEWNFLADISNQFFTHCCQN
jgi:hypothetical protein